MDYIKKDIHKRNILIDGKNESLKDYYNKVFLKNRKLRNFINDKQNFYRQKLQSQVSERAEEGETIEESLGDRKFLQRMNLDSGLRKTVPRLSKTLDSQVNTI